MSQSGADNEEPPRQYVNMRDVHQPNARMQAEIFVENNRNIWMRSMWMSTQHRAAGHPIGPLRDVLAPNAHAVDPVSPAGQDIQQHPPAIPTDNAIGQNDNGVMDHAGRYVAPTAVMVATEEAEARQARSSTTERHAYLIDSSESEDEEDGTAVDRRIDSAAAHIPTRPRHTQSSARTHRNAMRPPALRFPGLPDIPAEAIQALISMLEEVRQDRLARAQE